MTETTTIEGARAAGRPMPSPRWSARLQRLVRSAGLTGVAALGVLAAAGVGYLTSQNPRAAPAGGAAAMRVAIILALVGAGVYARTSKLQVRMGRLLLIGGLFSVVWLLNGSSVPLAFSIGVLCASFAVVGFAYLAVVHPSGRLHSAGERRFFVGAGGSVVLLWTLNVLTSTHPSKASAIVRCGAHCPRNVFFIGALHGAAESALTIAIVAACFVMAWATPILLARRARGAPMPLRRSLRPLRWVSAANALCLTAYGAAHFASLPVAGPLGTAYVTFALVIPLAILLGLWLQRLFMGRALADFVGKLARFPRADPQKLMATTLRDPSLRIIYRRPRGEGYVDSSGASVSRPEAGDCRAVTWAERDGRSLAAVVYDAELADQEQFVQAAAAAAVMRLERARLEADLAASTSALAASRNRLVEAAYSERQRIERDLHDGIQQDLVGARLKLEMAAEAIRDDQGGAERTMAAVGRQIDDVLAGLRSLARGIYPILLSERGVAEALRSVAHRAPLPASVVARGIERYPTDIEVAVYFTCLEALQNAAKHAGAGATVTIRLWQDFGRLCFEVRDDGVGFDPQDVTDQHGLVNMRDRIEAVGGTLDLVSGRGRGTTVSGRIAAQRMPAASAG